MIDRRTLEASLYSSLCVYEYIIVHNIHQSQGSSVSMRVSHGLDDRGSIPNVAMMEFYSLHHSRVQTGSGVHPASYSMSIGAKTTGA
jgi:hypothetical protein